MADEPAVTLKDVTTTPNPAAAAATPLEPASAPVVAAPPAPAITDAEATELGRILLDSGITRDRINDVLQAPQALESLRYLIRENPQEFLTLLERTDPATAQRFHEKMADIYVDRYGRKASDLAAPKSGDGTAASPELMQEVEALREEVGQFRSERDKAQAAASMAQVKTRYEARVDDLFGQLPKDLSLTKAESKALRAQLNQELAEDPTVVQRVSNGNFVDVPRRFQSIVEGWAADRKAAAEAAKSQRDRSSSRAHPEFPAGPNPLLIEVPKGTDDSWEATEDGLARALEEASR